MSFSAASSINRHHGQMLNMKNVYMNLDKRAPRIQILCWYLSIEPKF